MVSVPLCVTGVSATVRNWCQCHCASLVSVPLFATDVSATVVWPAEEALTGACTSSECPGTAGHCTLVQRCSMHLTFTSSWFQETASPSVSVGARRCSLSRPTGTHSQMLGA